MKIHTTAWMDGANVKVTFEREGYPASVYLIDPDARIITVDNPLPVLIDPAPDFRKAIDALKNSPLLFEITGIE